MEPETFGRYRLQESIGRGGMAEVFLAKQEGIAGIERRLAIKRIHPQFTSDDNFVKMFIDEARIVGHFSHQNIVQMLDFGKIGETYYIAMEYVDGVSLAGIMGNSLKAGVRIPTEAIIELGTQIALGMDYAHNGTDEKGQPLGIIHRDLTPHNILVSRAGTVKITDFGIAKASMNTHMTQAGMIKGKVPYMSPEQAMGQPLDRRSDLFSIGIILYEMCVLQRLFHGPSDFHVLQKVIAADIPSIRHQNPDVPEALEAIVLKLLSQDREKRFPSAGALADALRQLKYTMGETFSRFNLGAYVIHVIEEPQTALEEAEATIMAPTDRVKPKAAPGSAFDGLKAKGDEGFSAGDEGAYEEDVRTVLMMAGGEESPKEEGRGRLGGEAATRLIHTGETGKDDVAAAIAAAKQAEDAAVVTMMAPPRGNDVSWPEPAAPDEGDAPTLMTPRAAYESGGAKAQGRPPAQGPAHGPADGDAPTMFAPGPGASATPQDAPTMFSPGGSSSPYDDPDATMLPGMMAPQAQRTREILGPGPGPSPKAPTAPAQAAKEEDDGPKMMEMPTSTAAPPTNKKRLAAIGAVVVLALLFLGWFFGGKGSTRGALTVQANPDGAVIFLNGERASETGVLTRDDLPTGVQLTVRVEKDGYMPQEEVVVLSGGQSLALPITLVPETLPDGFLSVQSEPSGARILLGGKPTTFVTPARIPLKPGQDYEVTIELAGYTSVEQMARIKSGQDTPLNVSLAPDAPAAPDAPPQ